MAWIGVLMDVYMGLDGLTTKLSGVDVDSGDLRVEAKGFTVPAAVKFNSKGQLFVLDTGAGKVIKVEDGNNIDFAIVETGLDNLAFNARDELFVQVTRKDMF